MRPKTRELVVFAVLVTLGGAPSGCKKHKETASGYEPEFRRTYPGTPCKRLTVTTGPAKELCTSSRERERACSVFWGHDASTTMALIEGQLEGTICRRYETCTDGAVDVVAAAMLDSGARWIPPGIVDVADGQIDLERSLEITCTGAGERLRAPAAELRTKESGLKTWTPDAQRAVVAAQGATSDIYMLRVPSTWRDDAAEGRSVDVGTDVDGFDTKRSDYWLLLAGKGDGYSAFYSCEPGAAGVLSLQAPAVVRVPGGAGKTAAAPIVEIAFSIRSRSEVGEWCENHLPGATYAIKKRAVGLDAGVIGVRVRDGSGAVLADWSPL